MKNFILHSKKALTFCFLIASVITFAQTTITVNNNANSSADFDDLQTAIDAATTGDIIYLQQSSTSYGTITLTKGLTIIGRSHSLGGYKSEVATINFEDGSSDTTIKGLKITGNITDSGTAATLSNLAFFDNEIYSIYIGSLLTIDNVLFQGNIIKNTCVFYANLSNVLINNNIFFSVSISFAVADTVLFNNNIIANYYGVTITNSSTGLLNITNCIFISNYGSNSAIASFSGTGSFQVDNCISYNYGAGSYTFSTGANISVLNLQENVDPLFTNVSTTAPSIADPNTNTMDPANDDLTLQAGSTVTDDGIFQGYDFKNYGEPIGTPSIKIDSYSSTVPKNSNLTVTITAKTN